MAEPNGKLNAVWNAYFKDALTIIRETNPVRPVIVGPAFYNSVIKLTAVGSARAGTNTFILTFHYYNPFQFTMQGEDWFPIGKPREWIGTPWKGIPAEKQDVISTMNAIADWAQRNNRPVLLGEFGAGDHADIDSKARYFSFIRQQAELRNFSWCFLISR